MAFANLKVAIFYVVIWAAVCTQNPNSYVRNYTAILSALKGASAVSHWAGDRRNKELLVHAQHDGVYDCVLYSSGFGPVRNCTSAPESAEILRARGACSKIGACAVLLLRTGPKPDGIKAHSSCCACTSSAILSVIGPVRNCTSTQKSIIN